MHPVELFNEVKKQYKLKSDLDVAEVLGLTSGRISQLRSGAKQLSVRQVTSFLLKAAENARKTAFVNAIRPSVEMYRIDVVSSRQDAKWELLPTNKRDTRNHALRKHLESIKGVYLFYDSQGRAIYAGKTEKQNIWKEMTHAFNRERSNHQAFFVSHPSTGQSFSPAWETPRQPRKQQVYLHDTAHYFSAYEVNGNLIPKLEAFIVRAFCNTLSNKKMETF